MPDKKSGLSKKKAAELFWESIPPIWYLLRSYIDKISREKYEITGGHFYILRRIKDGDTSVSELADARHISRPVVSKKVDSLVEKGLVSRRESPEDRRFTVLELTPEGEEIMADLLASNRAQLRGLFESLNDQEIETIIQAFLILKKTTI
jgi:DNA-binding MarR family transcriptional regulator